MEEVRARLPNLVWRRRAQGYLDFLTDFCFGPFLMCPLGFLAIHRRSVSRTRSVSKERPRWLNRDGQILEIRFWETLLDEMLVTPRWFLDDQALQPPV